MNNTPAISKDTLPEHLTSDDLTHQVTLIQQVMKNVMTEDEHYGVIPGTQKPTLLKPGAEKLSMTFKLAPSYEIERLDLPGDHREYVIICSLTHTPSGTFQGSGVGSCSSMESRYRWRKGKRICPECAAEAIIKDNFAEKGGWVCWVKKDGCGFKWPLGATEIEGQSIERIENEDIADQYNTILKIAKKRAHVDAVLTVTGASDIFTQDLEELKNKLPTEPKDDPPPPEPEPEKVKLEVIGELSTSEREHVNQISIKLGIKEADHIELIEACGMDLRQFHKAILNIADEAASKEELGLEPMDLSDMLEWCKPPAVEGEVVTAEEEVPF